MLFYYYGGNMNNNDVMYKFIRCIIDNNIVTKFIINVFDYVDLCDYNYIFRVLSTDKEIILDIYDNVSIIRFNRYIFNFSDSFDVKEYVKDDVHVTEISVLSVSNINNKLFKLAYLFRLKYDDMLVYADSFLDEEFVSMLMNIIK